MKKKALSLFLAFVMALGMAVPALAADETPATPYAIPADVAGKLVVIHTNDTHGHDVAAEGETVGTAGVAALKKDFEAAGASVLLLSAGDFSQGTTLVSLDKGASAVDFMNAAGYDAAALGNHEFDYKMDALKANAAKAQFPILAANIVDSETKAPLFGDHITFDTAIGKVGVFGLDTPEAMTKAHPDNVKGLTFYQGDELVACAQAQVDALKADGCAYIIALTHLGVDPESEPNRSEDVFAKVNGVDLVVDGHSHTKMDGGVKAGNALVVSTGEYLENVGVVITDGTTTTAKLVSAAEYTKVDEAVAAVIGAKDAEVQAAMSQSFGTTEVLLNGERAPGNRTEETNLGDFATDAILWQARQNLGEDKVDAALTNGGGIRASIPAGNITMNDMKTVFPFGNTIVTIDVTGAQLLEALESATCSTPTAIGAFPQVAGITFSIDTSVKYAEGDQYPDSTYFAPAAPGSRVTISDVNGKGFDPAATYTIATNDFTAAGGDTYNVFKESKNLTMTAVALEDALINYTSEVLGGTITAEAYGAPAGRIDVKYVGIDGAAWYAEAAKYAVDQGLMSSTGNGFDPSANVTRATVFQTLYNAEGKPAVETAASFTDVSGKWYADAAAWAETAGVATVGEDGLFHGERDITRGEIAAILARYAAYKKLDTTAGDLTAFADADAVEAWALEGMQMVVGSQIISGKPGNLLDPNGQATRAELAAILKNFSALVPAEPGETGSEPTGYAYTETAVTFEVPETDGIPAHTVPAIVTVPQGEEGQTFPGVVMLHGTGSEKNEAGGGYAIAAPILAAQGIASIRFDFMGNGESAADYVNYNYTSAKLDTKAAADYLAKEAAVDGAKLGVMGWSQGGTDAIVAAAAYPDTFKAVVTWSGAVALDGAGLFGEKTFKEAQAIADKDGYFEMTFDWREPLHLGAQWFKEVKATDIVKETAKVKAPILAINGLADTTVTPDNADKIVAASKNDKSFAYLMENCDHTYNVFAEAETGYPTIKKAIDATADYLNGILNDTVLTVPVTVKNGERYVPAVITLPAGKGDFPAVVMNHGHGGSKDENVGFTGIADTLAQSGIASIRMDFPGCGESTQPFTENNMTNMISDSNACKDYLVKNAPVKKNELGILGYSMGGRVTLEILSKTGAPYKAAVLLAPAANDGKELTAGIAGEETAAIRTEAMDKGEATYTTQYGQELTLSKQWFTDLESSDPLKNIKRYKGAMLVINGDVDTVVVPATNQMVLDANPKAEHVLVSGADHGYGFYSDQPGVTAQVEGTIAGFFAKEIGKLPGSVKGAVASPDKYGNLTTDILSKDLYAAGYQMGDMLKVKIGSTTFEAPFVGTYSDVAVGAKLVRAPADGAYAIIAINHGDLATEAKAKAGTEITITLAKAAGYLDEYEARNVDRFRTNVRDDYASDEVFANFREIAIGDIAEGVLYRSSSPVNPELGRNTYADALAKAAGVKTVVNLADSEETMKAYEGYDDSYYATLDVIALNMGVDFKADEFKTQLVKGLTFMTEHEGPYLFHCTEGKDRAGFTAILLEALMGGKLEEIRADYMLSYVNYYHVEKGTAKYDINAKIAEQMLCQIAGVDEGSDLTKVDLVKAAEDYLTGAGMTAEQIGALKAVLSGTEAQAKAA